MSFKTRRIREEKPRRSWFVVKKALAASRTLASKAGQWLRSNVRREKPETGKKAKKEVAEEKQSMTRIILKRFVVVCTSAVIVIFIFAGVAKALIALKVVNLNTFLNVTATDLPKDKDGFTNFLLLGRGDNDHDGIDLTDTMMILSIDPTKTHSAILLSIPRDLYMLDTNENGMGKSRVNELYRDYKYKLIGTKKLTKPEASSGALHELMRDIGDHIGLPIHHAVIVNFSGFVKAIDALGGIDVEVPYDITDAEYPGPNYTYQTFTVSAGPAHLDGETALKYARSRHTTSDFGRSARQQQILKALANKGKSLGLLGSPGKLLSLYKILSENVESTMSTSEFLGVARLAESVEQQNIVSMQLNDRNGLYGTLPEAGGFLYTPPRTDFGGASVLLPVSIPEMPVTWKQIRSFAHFIFGERMHYLQPTSFSVLNASGKTGLASVLTAELIRYGFTVDHSGNEPSGKKQAGSLVLYKTEADKPTAEYFAELLRLPLSPTPAPADFPADSLSPITIILGKDYAFSPFQSLLPTAP